jgi:hypothetical protein
MSFFKKQLKFFEKVVEITYFVGEKRWNIYRNCTKYCSKICPIRLGHLKINLPKPSKALRMSEIAREERYVSVMPSHDTVIDFGLKNLFKIAFPSVFNTFNLTMIWWLTSFFFTLKTPVFEIASVLKYIRVEIFVLQNGKFCKENFS